MDWWLNPRAAAALRAHGIRTLADLTVRIPRRRRWWAAIDGLGARSARPIEAFFAPHPKLTERARALITAAPPDPVVPWQQIRLPPEVDGSHGAFRGPRRMCTPFEPVVDGPYQFPLACREGAGGIQAGRTLATAHFQSGKRVRQHVALLD